MKFTAIVSVGEERYFSWCDVNWESKGCSEASRNEGSQCMRHCYLVEHLTKVPLLAYVSTFLVKIDYEDILKIQ